MKKQFKAVATIIAGTIGVGFLALPYSIYKTGTLWGLVVMLFAGFVTLITNLAYADIITKEKNNCQISEYTKKYLGQKASLIVTLVVVAGTTGILLAYSLLAGSAIKNILSFVEYEVSTTLSSILFVLISVIIMKYGIGLIGHLSEFAVFVLILFIIGSVFVLVPDVDLDNLTSFQIGEASNLFGISVFALYSTAAVPMIDEIIGYNKKSYKSAITVASIITFMLYLLFSLFYALAYGSNLSGGFLETFRLESNGVQLIIAVITLVAIFSSFVLVANTLKEIFVFDYKIHSKTAIGIISFVLIFLVLFEIGSFEAVISIVGSLALAIQSLFVVLIWLKLNKKKKVYKKIPIILAGVILLAGMISQLI